METEPSFTWQALWTLTVLAVMVFTLAKEWLRTEVAILGALGLFLASGILRPEEAFEGFSNHAMLTVAFLYVVAGAVEQTGALRLADRVLSGRGGARASLAKLMGSTAMLSAFLNNTPVVAMLLPRVQHWCSRNQVSASKMLIPLSYAAILGGMTTLIGTSTNLLVSGLLVSHGQPALRMFDLSWAGVPAALAALGYFLFWGHRTLPERQTAVLEFGRELRDCFFELKVGATSPHLGKSVEEASLRDLADAFLVHFRRGEKLVPSGPERRLAAGDVLVFRGSSAAMERLAARGLEREHASPGKNGPMANTLPLFEAVVAPGSALVGQTLKDVNFRERYEGVVLAIHRRDKAIEGPLGREPLEPGDLLLIEAADGFDKILNRDREDFCLVAPHRDGVRKPAAGKAWMSLGILVAVVALSATEMVPIVVASFWGALAILGLGILKPGEAGRAVDARVLIAIAGALGLGKALSNSGLAEFFGQGLVTFAAPLGPVGVIIGIYVATSLLTEMVTNNATAALMIPIGLAAAIPMGIPPVALGVTVAIAASASFITPIGYQTNMMVMAAGGYRFADFFRTGAMVSLFVGVVTVTMVAWHWL